MDEQDERKLRPLVYDRTMANLCPNRTTGRRKRQISEAKSKMGIVLITKYLST